MPNSSPVAFFFFFFLMILGQRYKKIFIPENLNKQMGTLSKTFPAGRISAALQREEKIKRLVESPGRRGPAEAGKRRGRNAESREKRREGERQVRGYGGRARKGGGRSGVWLGERVLRSPPPPPRPSGGSPKSPTVLHKGQSSGRQCSKTCYSSSLHAPPAPPPPSDGAARG